MTQITIETNPSIQCNNLKITKINFKKCDSLKELDCSYNLLKKLDLSQCPLLNLLNCTDNDLVVLDTSYNEHLEKLICDYNERLTSLDLTKNTNLKELSCRFSGITSLDCSNNLYLEKLDMLGSPLTILDISRNVNLKYIDLEGSNLTGIMDLSNHINLVTLRIKSRGNGISELNINNCRKLEILEISCDNLSKLDLSNNINLKIFSPSFSKKHSIKEIKINKEQYHNKVYKGVCSLIYSGSNVETIVVDS